MKSVRQKIKVALSEYLKSVDCDSTWIKDILWNVPLSRASDFEIANNTLTIFYPTNKKREVNLKHKLFRICGVEI